LIFELIGSIPEILVEKSLRIGGFEKNLDPQINSKFQNKRFIPIKISHKLLRLFTNYEVFRMNGTQFL
jgi:hypothetical protein